MLSDSYFFEFNGQKSMKIQLDEKYRTENDNISFILSSDTDLIKSIDKILFLENGSSSAGLKHIIERHWNEKELIRYFNSQDEMIQKIYSTINKEKFLTKEIVVRNGREGLEYTYKMSVKDGDKTFKFGVGSNGYIVTFYPQ